MSQKVIKPHVSTLDGIKARQAIDKVVKHNITKAFYTTLTRRFFWGVFGAGILLGAVLGAGLKHWVG